MNLREHLKTTDPHNPATNPQPHDSHKLAAAHEIIKTHRSQPWHTHRPTLTIVALTATAALGVGAVFVAPTLWGNLRGGDVAVQPADQKPTADPKLTAGTGDDESVVQREESQEITIRGHRMTVTGPIAVKDQMVETRRVFWRLPEGKQKMVVSNGGVDYYYAQEATSRYVLQMNGAPIDQPIPADNALSDKMTFDYAEKRVSASTEAATGNHGYNWRDLAADPSQTIAKAEALARESHLKLTDYSDYTAKLMLSNGVGQLERADLPLADRVAILTVLGQFPQIRFEESQMHQWSGIRIGLDDSIPEGDGDPDEFERYLLLSQSTGYAIVKYGKSATNPDYAYEITHKKVPGIPEQVKQTLVTAEKAGKCELSKANDNGDELRCRLTEQ